MTNKSQKTPSAPLEASGLGEVESAAATDEPFDNLANTYKTTFVSTAALIRADLASSPAVPNLSLRSLVVELRPELLQARRDGKGWKAIAASFRSAGIEAEPDTIRLYMTSATPTRAARAAKRPKPATAKSPSHTPVVVVKTVDASSDPSAKARRDGARIALRVK